MKSLFLAVAVSIVLIGCKTTNSVSDIKKEQTINVEDFNGLTNGVHIGESRKGPCTVSITNLVVSNTESEVTNGPAPYPVEEYNIRKFSADIAIEIPSVKTPSEAVAIESSEDFGYPGYYSQTDAFTTAKISGFLGRKKTVKINLYKARGNSTWNLRYEISEENSHLCSLKV